VIPSVCRFEKTPDRSPIGYGHEAGDVQNAHSGARNVTLAPGERAIFARTIHEAFHGVLRSSASWGVLGIFGARPDLLDARRPRDEGFMNRAG
jgi:hypothetical protein